MEVDAKPGEVAPLVEFWMLGNEVFSTAATGVSGKF